MLIVVALFNFNTATAQKIGHLSAEQIILEMPAYKSANSQLEALGQQLQKQLVDQENKIRTKVADAEANASNMTPVQIQTLQAELQKDQESLISNERKFKEDLYKKEQELTAPIYEKIKAAIKSVAEENGYKYVMESSSMLFAVDSDDITQLVKRKLGM